VIRHDFEQYSESWWLTRRGLPSASRASDIITPTGKLSASRKKYMAELLADKLDLGADPFEGTEHMQRGLDLEAEALAMFEMREDVDLERVGLVLNDEGTACCSPDALGPGYGVEAKCPMAKTHIEYLLAGEVPPVYRAQVHMSMVVTGLPTWYFISYYPELEPLIVKVPRDDYTDQVEKYLVTFIEEIHKAEEKLNGT
jgi:hypothetical protein